MQQKCDKLQPVVNSYESTADEPGLTRDQGLTELHDALTAKDEVIDASKQRRTELREQNKAITRERDQVCDTFIRQSLENVARGTPAAAAPIAKKIYKLVNPKRFDK